MPDTRKQSQLDVAEARAVTPDQLKAARALLGWNRIRLVASSGTSKYMVVTFEQTGRVASFYKRKEQVDGLAAMRAALEAAGIEFTSGDAPGVRLRKEKTA